MFSLSSAESELHSMISGTCDAIFVKNCMEFLLQVQIEHHQFTDNSAARQLIGRQGVGRIRHLSAKLLWLQDLTRLGEVNVSQVPTFWNYSDVGTKNLSKARLYFLLCGIGAVDPMTAEPIGQEEYDVATERDESRKALSKLGKAIKRISLILGVQSLESLAAEAKLLEICPKNVKAVERDNSAGLWTAVCVLCVLVMILATAFCCVWKKFNKRLKEQVEAMKQVQNDVFQCWSQVADEDSYIATQEARITEIHNRLMMHDGRLIEQSNEHSMLHDYACGLHYGLVESGGFLRFGFGLTTDQFTSLAMHERANLVAHGAMGSEQYLRLVRQRAKSEHADTTDVPMNHGANINVENNNDEQAESETSDDDEMIDEGEQRVSPMTQLMENVKEQHGLAVQRGDWRDANSIQSFILTMITAISGGIDENLVNQYRERAADLFLQLADNARPSRPEACATYGRFEAKLRNRER